MHSQSKSSSHKNQRSVRLVHLRALYLVGFLLLLAAVLPHIPLSRNVSARVSEPAGKQKAPAFVPGEILVRFRKHAAATKSAARASFVVHEGLRQIPVAVERFGGSDLVDGLRLARVAPEDTQRAIVALQARDDVLYAEPNFVFRASALPNDPHFPELYGLKNTGQNAGFPGADIAAEQAWDITTGGANVVIGVIDTGIDIEHPDLRENVWKNASEIADNGLDDDGNGFIDDVNGWDFYNNDKTVYDNPDIDAHGTHVAGTVGATGNNGLGVVGVSWRVQLMPLKFLGSPDGTGVTSGAIAALQFAKKMRERGVNIRALNNSWGGHSFSQSLLDAINEINAAGILFVVSAGNDGLDNDSFPGYPANYDVANIVSVGAQGPGYERAPFSNFGERSVHVYAPGVRILSTTPRGYVNPDYTDPDGATYSFFDGTSMAAPHVTGTAALICSADPGISLSRLRNSILFGSRIVSNRNATISTKTHLKAFGSLQSALENDTSPPGAVTNLSITSQLGRRLDLRWTASGDDGPTGSAAVVYDISFVDSASGATNPLLRLQAASPGATPVEFVNVPYQHTAGRIQFVAFDNVGNESPPASVEVNVAPIVANPYIQSTGAANVLSTGGTPLQLKADDRYSNHLSLPVGFRFFDEPASGVVVSTNGALYFLQPRSLQPPANDSLSTVAGLQHYAMIAGLWDDLRTDRRPDDDVYMVQPDPDRVIFRWQGVTFDTPLGGGLTRGENPVSFEIELQRGGGIVIRYGDGNTSVRPVVGISGAEPEAFLVGSHTSETALINLSNAQSIHFGLPPCSYTISPDSQSMPADGNSGSFTVTTGSACAWTATSNVSWILISFGANSIGSRIVSYDLISNQSINPRTGTIAVAGHTFTVFQPGISCSYQVGTTVQSFPASGGFSGTSVITVGDCPWTAVSSASWVTITSASSGSGNGGIGFSVAANPTDTPRTGTISVADKTVTINQAAGANPIDDARNFIRQHYLDFLSREPDQGGWDYWTSEITACGTDAACVHRKRIDVSAAYFVELEFQRTGYVVYRLYRAAHGTMPNTTARANVTYAQFNSDRAQLVDGAGLEQSTINLANAFVQRPEFLQAYPNGLTNALFVNKLFDTAQLAPYTTERQQQIDAMNNNGKTRAQVLRDVIETAEFKTREYNPAFVLMQYFGYLRRDPDQGGYDFWLNVLNNRVPNNFRAMVCAFLTSAEYQQRFGSAITRTNNDCSQ